MRNPAKLTPQRVTRSRSRRVLDHGPSGHGWAEEMLRPATPDGAFQDLAVEANDVEPEERGLAADDDAVSGSDTLSVYLREMGSIPLLRRDEELELAQRLDRSRRRYRRAVLWSWHVVGKAADTFERIRAGALSLDRSIDVVPSLGLTVDRIRRRLPSHLKVLRGLLEEQRGLAAPRGKSTRRRRHEEWQRLRRAVATVENLSPRVELLDQWSRELGELTASRGRLCRDPEAARRFWRELRATPEGLQRLYRVQRQRRQEYVQARQELAQANLRLVVSIAKKYRGHGLAFADLIQEGNSALMRAVDKFDYRLGFKFGTYATWWIRQGIQRALHDHARTVRVPSHQNQVMREMDRVRGELMVRHGREPRGDEVAAALGISAKDVRQLHAAGRQPVSLQESFTGGEEDRAFLESLRDTQAVDPGQAADSLLLKDRLDEVLRALAPRDREVIELRYGLRDGRAHSLDEVAQKYGITRERVRQIESRGLLKLRQPERRDRLAEFAEVE